MSRLVCCGVIAPTNAPLHVHSFLTEAEAEDLEPDAFFHVLHCALDVVEERLEATTIRTSAGGGPGGAVPGAARGPKDPFLGMVFPTEDYRVYAYVTNTRARLLLVYDDVADPGEATVREAFAKLHDAYADAMSDPFAAPGRPIENARFKARVRALAAPA